MGADGAPGAPPTPNRIRMSAEKACFFGRLCATGRLLPSDLHGLVYKKVDSSLESQAFGLIRELKTAGYQITI